MQFDHAGQLSYCHKCLSKMAIRCAWCEEPIFIGDPVTLYTPSVESRVSQFATVFTREPLQVVGCLRMSCADTGGDCAGIWIPTDEGKGGVNAFRPRTK